VALVGASQVCCVRLRASSALPPRTSTIFLNAALSSTPATITELLQLSTKLLQLQASPVGIAELTDAIGDSQQEGGQDHTALSATADFLKRQRRSQLLVDLLKSDRAAYVETVSFLPIPRHELPNRQDVPLRACDIDARRPDASSAPLVDGLDADGLVPDCALEPQPMGENVAEGVLLEVTRDIYAAETGVPRAAEKGIRGLLDEMRRFMLSPQGADPAAQQEVLIKTLRVLMTPALPPFYRVFMGGIVPKLTRPTIVSVPTHGGSPTPCSGRAASCLWGRSCSSRADSSGRGFMRPRSRRWWRRSRLASWWGLRG